MPRALGFHRFPKDVCKADGLKLGKILIPRIKWLSINMAIKEAISRQQFRWCILSLGSNMPPRRYHIYRAERRLMSFYPQLRLICKSIKIQTVPVGKVANRSFINGLILAKTYISAESLLYCIKKIESACGRAPSLRWSNRIIDLDIVCYGDLHINLAHICVPHDTINRHYFKPLYSDLRQRALSRIQGCETLLQFLAFVDDLSYYQQDAKK